MNMIEAVRSCSSKYFRFSGRAMRSEYWYWILFTVIASIILGVIDVVFFSNLAASGVEPLGTTFSLLTFFPGLAVTWRRLHDTGRSGWWYGGAILALIPISMVAGFMMFSFSGEQVFTAPLGVLAIIAGLLGVIWLIIIIIFTVQDSQYGENQYGPNPKDEGNVSVFD